MKIAMVALVDGQENDNLHWVDRDNLLHLFLFKLSDNTEMSVYITERGNWVLERNFLFCYTSLNKILHELRKLGVQISQIFEFSERQLKKNDDQIDITQKECYQTIVNEILKGEL